MEQQKYKEGVRRRFDSYCKKVLKHSLIDFYRERNRRSEREITFSDMSTQALAGLATFDEYFTSEYVFNVLGERINVSDSDLAEALCALPVDRLEIVLMSYFLGMKDREIAEQLNMVRGTVCYQRNSSLKKLKKIMESAG